MASCGTASRRLGPLVENGRFRGVVGAASPEGVCLQLELLDIVARTQYYPLTHLNTRHSPSYLRPQPPRCLHGVCTAGGVYASPKHATLARGPFAALACHHRVAHPTGRLSQHREQQHAQHRCAVREAAPLAKTAARQPQWAIGSSLTWRALRSFKPAVWPAREVVRMIRPRSATDSKVYQGVASCRASLRTAAAGPPPAAWWSCASRSRVPRCSPPSSDVTMG